MKHKLERSYFFGRGGAGTNSEQGPRAAGMGAAVSATGRRFGAGEGKAV
jgi:hypothetical protein